MYHAMKVKVSLLTCREAETGTMANSNAFALYCRDMQDLAQESFQVLTLNQKNMILDRHLISLGSLSACAVHPREVLRPAILNSAAAICILHNHPSGDPKPSNDDQAMTKRIKSACELMGINLLDHIIIGRNVHYSFIDQGDL
jgi:DNA repair protein RadC